MGTSSSKPKKHAERVKRKASRREEIIAQGPASSMPHLYTEMIQELRKLSSNEKLHREIDELEASLSLRQLGDKHIRSRLFEIATKNGIAADSINNLLYRTTASESLSR